jgi:hypothetical protein
MKATTIGIDVAKDVFGLHGVDSEGRVAFKKRLVRSRLLEFLSQLPPCLVGLEACSSAHFWARKIEQLGHRVRLMNPRFVKPYRKSDNAFDNPVWPTFDIYIWPTLVGLVLKLLDTMSPDQGECEGDCPHRR